MTACHLLCDHDESECRALSVKWLAWAREAFSDEPPAMIDLSIDYEALLDRKSRQTINKAKRRGYAFGTFTYDDRLAEMHAINTSKESRQERPMADGYREMPRPLPLYNPAQFCARHRVEYIGGFKDDILLAYAWLVVCGDVAILNRIIGHADSLTDGVMNGLVDNLVTLARSRGCKWLNYLRMPSSTESLTAFKRSVGFRSIPMEFVL